jgi:hypothetical protein
MAQKRSFISNHIREFETIQKGCEMMEISRGSYYCSSGEDKKLSDLNLRDKIEHIQLAFPGYGYRRIEQVLKREGSIVNHKRIKRVMKIFGLKSCLYRRRNRLKIWGIFNNGKAFPNLVAGKKVTGASCQTFECKFEKIIDVIAYRYSLFARNSSGERLVTNYFPANNRETPYSGF